MGEETYEIKVEQAPVLIDADTQFWELRDVYKEPLEGTPVYETVDGQRYTFADEDVIMELVDPPFAGRFRFSTDEEVARKP